MQQRSPSPQVQIALLIVVLAIGVLIGRFLTPPPPAPSLSAAERTTIAQTAQAEIVPTILAKMNDPRALATAQAIIQDQIRNGQLNP